MPVDEATFERFQRAQRRAAALGLSLPEVLDHKDVQLLLTARRRHELRVEAARELALRFERQAPHKLMSYRYNRVEGTAAEMFDAVQEWLEIVLRNWADNTLEPL